MASKELTRNKPMKYSPLNILLVSALFLAGCAGQSFQQIAATTGNITGDILTDVEQAGVTYLDAQTALKAAQQSMGGHGVSVGNIGAYATAEASSANTTGLPTAIETLETDIANQIAAGTSQATISAQIAKAQTTLTP